MPEHVVLIGTDTAGLDAVLQYQQGNPAVRATALYPDHNPLPEFSCSIMGRYLGRGIEFPERLRACGIDRDNKRIRVRDNISGADSFIAYDKVVFASGAAPGDLDIRGELPGKVLRISGHAEANRLFPMEGTTVVVGNGLNMLLTVSALLKHGKGDIAVIPEYGRDVVTPLSASLAAMVYHTLGESGVTVHENARLETIQSRQDGLRLVTDTGTIDADRIINATHSVPVTDVAEEAGLETDPHGGIVVDAAMRTSDPDIYACGSCAAFINEICDNPIPGNSIRASVPRQSRILAGNLGGESAPFTAIPGAWSVTVADLTISGTGLTVEGAKACGFDKAMSATAIQFDRAHFMPDAALMTLELVFDPLTRRVLGIQGISTMGDGLCGRISAVSAILSSKPTVDDVANLEVAYSPPFASAMDVLNTVANVADNMLAGVNEGIDASEFERLWAERETNDHFFLDCRELGNAAPFIEQYPDHWNHIPQGELGRRLAEIPEDMKIILLCNTGARSYEAQVELKHAGRTDVVNVDGGMTALRQTGVKV